MSEENLADAFGMTEGTQEIKGLDRRSSDDTDLEFDENESWNSFDQGGEDDVDNMPQGDPEKVDSDNLDAFPVGVYLLPDVIRNITRVRRRTGQQNADIALDSIDQTHRRERLGKLVLKRAQGVKRPKSSLFPSRDRQPRAQAGRQGRKLWTFQATEAQRAVLEDLVEQYQATSVSELVSVAVEHKYAPRRNRGPYADS